MKGDRNRQDGLWHISIPAKDCTTSLPRYNDFKLNYIVTTDKSQSELLQYFYGTAFSPRIDTLSMLFKMVTSYLGQGSKMQT